ncbi:uncharacterized protein RJT21DRAFT_123561 [Scheffersomyces amazonensis]|uniref:uncharacterized protein n=1 Tax=Scheffersomyces amazonensis TaxID=1078765 RepID=UPI00315D3933
MDITSGSSSVFKPADYAKVPDSKVSTNILFNVIHIENIAVSRLSQLEDWREYEDPSKIAVDRINQSRRIIREISLEDDQSSMIYQPIETYKLLLRDFSNNYCYAYEKEPLRFLRESQSQTRTLTPLKIQLGGRLRVLSGAKVINGVIYLDNGHCQYLGLQNQDQDLIDNLNTGLVLRNIEILRAELDS